MCATRKTFAVAQPQRRSGAARRASSGRPGPPAVTQEPTACSEFGRLTRASAPLSGNERRQSRHRAHGTARRRHPPCIHPQMTRSPGKRQRPIRARSSIQASRRGGRTNYPGLEAHRPITAYPSAFSQQSPGPGSRDPTADAGQNLQHAFSCHELRQRGVRAGEHHRSRRRRESRRDRARVRRRRGAPYAS